MSTDNDTTVTEAAAESKESCCGKQESCCQEKKSCCFSNGFLFSDLTWAMLLLRAWIGLRMLAAGIVKFKSISPDGAMTISLENYYGKEGEAGSGWVNHAFEPFWKYGGLPEDMARLYTSSLGWLMLLGGFLIFFGITNRLALIFGAAVMLSLSFGLFTLDDSQEIGYIAAQFGLFVAAIALAKHNRLMVFGKF
jgi:hypothetical protein